VAGVDFGESIQGIQSLRDRFVAHLGQDLIHFVSAKLLLRFREAMVGLFAKQ
jgi:hypothetical protein